MPQLIRRQPLAQQLTTRAKMALVLCLVVVAALAITVGLMFAFGDTEENTEHAYEMTEVTEIDPAGIPVVEQLSLLRVLADVGPQAANPTHP